MLADGCERKRRQFCQFARGFGFVATGGDEQPSLGMREGAQDFVEINGRGVSPE
jgi:hypothetical protein